VCEVSVKAKFAQTPHKKPFCRGEYLLEFLHINVVGPLPKAIHGGHYWMTIINDFSSYTGAISLSSRKKAALFLKQYLNRWERPERRRHHVRLDQAGEHTSKDLDEYCKACGIHLEFTGTDQHQSNGTAEVTNRILEERVHTTLIDSSLPVKYWPFMAVAVAYLRNLNPHVWLKMTPY
jgi:hypothetical protein